MKLAKYADLPWLPGYGGRDKNDTVYRCLFAGTPGEAGDFEFDVWRRPTGVVIPKHRHSCDQIRYSLVGNENIAPGRDVLEGCIGFFPEGTSYGPQNKDPRTESLLLQFEGASKSGFAQYTAMRAAKLELDKKGEFKDGIYSWTDKGGEMKRLDSHQATWEQATGRKEIFPKTRYDTPQIVFPESFEWQTRGNGAYVRDFGRFGEGQTAISMARVSAGAYTLASVDRRTLGFVLSGTGSVQGEPLVERDGMFLQIGESATFESTGNLKVLLIGLPVLN